MKTITSLAATVGIVITISSCGLGKIRQGVNKIERGMTKEQVTSLLGAPLNRSIQADQSELWEYNFSDFPGNSISVHVTFVNDRVSQFDSKENAPSPARTTTYLRQRPSSLHPPILSQPIRIPAIGSTPTQGTILDEAIAIPTEKMLGHLSSSIAMYKS